MKTLRIAMSLALLIPLSACGNQILGWPVSDETPPEIIATTPVDDAVDVDLTTLITATFNEDMDPLTLDTATFTVRVDQTPVTGDVTYTNRTVTFHPDQALSEGVVFHATINGAADLAGNTVVSPYTWSFTTVSLSDNIAPFVISVAPEDNATEVPLNTNIAATFSEAMDPATLTELTFELAVGGVLVPGAVAYLDLSATFNPTADLLANTEYTATIRTGATDLAGNALANDYVWTFTTGPVLDTERPRVTSTNPVDDETGVPIGNGITVVFSEAMDPLTITPANFTLQQGVATIDGTVSYIGLTAVFNPTNPLIPDTIYSVTVTTSVQDLAGNALNENYVWNFQTGAVADTTAPRVLSTIPDNLAINVFLDADVTAHFSEVMDPLTVTTASVTLENGIIPVLGTVTLVGDDVTFNPAVNLLPNTEYTATISTMATDLAGNPLAADYVWTFTTGAALDTQPPTVTSTTPADLGMDVALNASVNATFSEPMRPQTITTATFTLELPNGTEVLGTVSYDLVTMIATFTPADDLLPNTTYTATVTNGVADLSGNNKVADYVWTFTTGVAPDAQPPTVTDTDPADLDIDVALNTTVNATFSEPMSPPTITNVTFTLELPNGTEVLGTVSYDSLTMTATFTPADDLLPNTTYTATVTNGVADLAGNNKVADYVWTFTTGAAVIPGLQPVNLGSLISFVAVAGAGLTNSNSSGVTTLNGDVGLSPTATCLGDGIPCTLTNPVINGTLYANDPGGIAALAKIDLIAAYVDAMSRPPGTTVNDISGMVLAPGVYTSASTMSVAVGGTVTLDGQGDANSVFIFQVGSSLTVNNNAQVLLINGATAKNVFWAVGASSTLGSNVDFTGSVLAQASNSVGTDSTVIGRLLCTTGQITLLSNTITLPAP